MLTGRRWSFRFRRVRQRSGRESGILRCRARTISRMSPNHWERRVTLWPRGPWWFYCEKGSVGILEAFATAALQKLECEDFMSGRSKVIIIGGGFGGLNAAQTLRS